MFLVFLEYFSEYAFGIFGNVCVLLVIFWVCLVKEVAFMVLCLIALWFAMVCPMFSRMGFIGLRYGFYKLFSILF